MSAQPFSDPQIYEVNARQVDYHWSTRYLIFSDADGPHQFHFDHHPGYIPVTMFIRDGDAVNVLIAWSHPLPFFLSDF